jgi:carbonic anhydrase/acetyltransferase-like protein (isoleucine patch superfamily)
MSKKNLSLKKNIMAEILALLFNVFIPGIVWGSSLMITFLLLQTETYWGLIFLPLVATLIFITVVFAIRIVMPRVKPGAYDLKKDPMVMIWYLHMCLNRSVKSVGLLGIIRSSNVLRFLHLRALGAKVAYSANVSVELELADPMLITIEENVIVGGRCYMGCHVVVAGKLILGTIHLKKNSFVSLGNVLGQGTVVGENATVGVGNYLYRDVLPDNYQLPNFVWAEGSPKHRDGAMKKAKENLTKPEFKAFHQAQGMMNENVRTAIQ